MAINSRNKGASAEREFSNIIYQWAGIRLIRNLEQSRSGGFDLTESLELDCTASMSVPALCSIVRDVTQPL